MSNASKDENNVSALIAVLNTDGLTVVPVKANPATHALMTSDGTTGTDHGPNNAEKDENFVSTLIAVSSADGKTPVAVYADSSGNLLTKST